MKKSYLLRCNCHPIDVSLEASGLVFLRQNLAIWRRHFQDRNPKEMNSAASAKNTKETY